MPRSTFRVSRRGMKPGQRRAERETSAGGVIVRRGRGHDLLRQRARRAAARRRDGSRPLRRRGWVTAIVPVFHPRREARRAVQRGYPRTAGRVRLCRDVAAVERLLFQKLVDAVVLDVKAAPEQALALATRFPRIPMYALSSFRPDDGPLLAACRAAGVAACVGGGGGQPPPRRWGRGPPPPARPRPRPPPRPRPAPAPRPPPCA